MTSDSPGPMRSGREAGDARRGPTRRQALAAAGASAAALSFGIGPFSHLLNADAADVDASPEITLTSFLVTLELAAADLYKEFASKATDPAIVSLAQACESHHAAHGNALGSMVSAAGAQVPTAGNDAFTAEMAPRIAPTVSPSKAALALADLENSFAATYLSSLSTITSASLGMIAAQILATDSAHSVAWSAVATGGGTPVPLPNQSSLVSAQSTDGAFDQTSFASTTSTTAGATS